MERVTSSSRAADLFGAGKDGYKDGTVAEPKDLNGFQEAVMTVQDAAELVADGENFGQFLEALYKLFGRRERYNVLTHIYGTGATPTYVRRPTGNTFDLSTSSINLSWSNDGRELYAYSSSGVHRYSTSAPYDIAGLSETGSPFDPGANTYAGIFVRNDGTKLYVNDTTDDVIREFDMSTPGDLSTALQTGVSPAYTPGTLNCLWIDPSGNYVFAGSATENRLYRFDLSLPWNITTMGATAAQSVSMVNATILNTSILDVAGSPDGTSFAFADDFDTGGIIQVQCGTGFDLSTAGDVGRMALPSGIGGVAWSAHGGRIITCDASTVELIEYASSIVG